jgi:hypothetical protein
MSEPRPAPVAAVAPPAPAARRRFVLHPFEIAAYALTLIVVAILRAHGLRMNGHAFGWSFVPMIENLPRVLAIGLGLQVAGHLLTRRSLGDWLRRVARPRSLVLWLRLWFAAMALTFSYTWLKVCVPLLRTRVFDPELWRLDRALHLGVSPSIFVTQLFHGTVLTPLFDSWDGLWVTSVLGLLSYGFLADDPRARRHVATAWILLGFAGVFIYLALPALGPCYSFPDVFADVLPRMPDAAAGQRALWGNYVRMIAGRDGSLRQFNPYLGIAAMPSLHVGADWMFALWARRFAPRLFLPLALATLLTFLASLLTGWHFAVDGYVGLALAWLAVRAADRLEPGRREPAGDTPALKAPAS